MIKLKTKKRKITSGANKGKDAYIVVRDITSSMLTMEQIEEQIMKSSSLTRGDVRAAISCLSDCISEALDRGASVDLGDIGTLYTQISSPYRFDKKDITPDDVSLKLKIKPKKRIKQALDNAVIRIDHTTD